MNATLTRDMTKTEFDRRVAELGFRRELMGYYRLPAPYDRVSVCAANAGNRRRDRLAYLLKCLEREENKAAHE